MKTSSGYFFNPFMKICLISIATSAFVYSEDLTISGDLNSDSTYENSFLCDGNQDQYFDQEWQEQEWQEQEWQEVDCYDESAKGSPRKFRGHIFALGPEFSYLQRKRDGGTKQHGIIYGVRASYDHIKRYKFYWGALAYYGTGNLSGKTITRTKLKSQWTDELIEGNVGYTFAYKECPHYSFTHLFFWQVLFF